MTDFLTMADAEAVVSMALRDANLAGLEDRVYSSIPKHPVYPLALVQRIGGIPPVRQYLDGARIQVDIYGGAKDESPSSRATKSDIHDIAQEARIAILDLEGKRAENVDAFITGVNDAQGLTWAPDPGTSRDRYMFAVLLYLHPVDGLVS